MAAAQTDGTDAVIFYTLKVIHENTQKLLLPKDLLLKCFNGVRHYKAIQMLHINRSCRCEAHKLDKTLISNFISLVDKSQKRFLLA